MFLSLKFRNLLFSKRIIVFNFIQLSGFCNKPLCNYPKYFPNKLTVVWIYDFNAIKSIMQLSDIQLSGFDCITGKDFFGDYHYLPLPLRTSTEGLRIFRTFASYCKIFTKIKFHFTEQNETSAYTYASHTNSPLADLTRMAAISAKFKFN